MSLGRNTAQLAVVYSGFNVISIAPRKLDLFYIRSAQPKSAFDPCWTLVASNGFMVVG